MLVQVLNLNFHFKVCMNVRDLGLFLQNFPNNLCERQNCPKTVFPVSLSGMAVLFPVLRTGVPSSRAPNMILSLKIFYHLLDSRHRPCGWTCNHISNLSGVESGPVLDCV